MDAKVVSIGNIGIFLELDSNKLLKITFSRSLFLSSSLSLSHSPHSTLSPFSTVFFLSHLSCNFLYSALQRLLSFFHTFRARRHTRFTMHPVHYTGTLTSFFFFFPFLSVQKIVLLLYFFFYFAFLAFKNCRLKLYFINLSTL